MAKAASSGLFFWTVTSHPVNEDVKAQPHHVHKVPVPGGAFKTEMLVGAEMPFLQAQRDEQQHQHANKYVKTVKARQHVKSRAIHAGTELEIEFGVAVEVFVTLNRQKGDPQQHRQPHEGNRAAAMIFAQGMVGNRQGHARAEQQRGVDGGQPERRHGGEGLNDVGR